MKQDALFRNWLMKKLLPLWMCMLAGLMSSSAPAMDICVQENSGCKDLRTGRVYVSEGNKLVDPETRQIYAVIPPVQVDAGKGTEILRPRNTGPSPPRDPITGRIIQDNKRVKILETEETKGTVRIPGRTLPIIEGGRLLTIPPRDVPVITRYNYVRTTTCAGLKAEIAALNRKWSELERWNRAEVSDRIDKLEAQYSDECR